MSINWHELHKEMFPIKDYDDLRQRWQVAFAYDFLRQAYNFNLPKMVGYTHLLLGGDARKRYEQYAQALVETLQQLHQAGVSDILELVSQVDSTHQFETFIDKTAIPAREVIALLKYLVYWFIPAKKYLSGLMVKDSPLLPAIQVLREVGVRTNLDLLDQGNTPAGRLALTAASGLPQAEILDLVNWADFSRLPWTSKATIANIMGAGYRSIAQLAGADPQQLTVDFFSYGKVIGKNLKLGNEIENSHRIAKILPPVLQED